MLHSKTSHMKSYRCVQSVASAQDYRVSGQDSYRVPSNKLEGGFALIMISVFCVVVGIISLNNIRVTTGMEQLASNSIQRSRVLQAAVAGSIVAERKVEAIVESRVFADVTATDGLFSYDSPDNKWWHNQSYTGENSVTQGEVLGVKSPPRYIVEELGSFSSDGGTGVANLDKGSGAYGRQSSGGRDFAVFRTESVAVGAQNGSYSIIEATFAFSY